VPASALALALAAALVHATWNLLVARASDPEAATAIAGVLGGLIFIPVALASWQVESAALPYAATSAAVHVGYFGLLALAYARADLSVVYPLARGSAPVLVLVGSVLALGESPTWLQAAGVLMVTTGVLMVRGVHGGDRTGELLGLGVGVTIAVYTVVDKQGVAHAHPIPYLVLETLPASLVFLAWVSRSRGRAGLRAELRPITVVAGIGMMGAYGLTLAALKLGPASGVAAVRETSILVATAFGALFLHERVGPLRAVGAAVIVAGVASLALG
jgi:drug/metabolite transporter (DMT)-like permease